MRAERGGGERAPWVKGAASREGQEDDAAERRGRETEGFEEETEEGGRAVTGYGIPA